MANAYLTAYIVDRDGGVKFSSGVSQTISTTGSSQKFDAVNTKRYFQYVCDGITSIKGGTDPTATADGTSQFVPANAFVEGWLDPNETIAVIDDA